MARYPRAKGHHATTDREAVYRTRGRLPNLGFGLAFEKSIEFRFPIPDSTCEPGGAQFTARPPVVQGADGRFRGMLAMFIESEVLCGLDGRQQVAGKRAPRRPAFGDRNILSQVGGTLKWFTGPMNWRRCFNERCHTLPFATGYDDAPSKEVWWKTTSFLRCDAHGSHVTHGTKKSFAGANFSFCSQVFCSKV